MPITVGEACDISELTDEWDALADRAGTSPFNRPGWIDSWWRAFGEGHLRILYARDAGGLAAVLPMYELRGTLRSPTNPHTPDFDVVATHEAQGRALIAAALVRARRRTDFSFIPEEGRAAHLIGDVATEHRHRIQADVALSSPFIAIDGTWEGFQETLARGFRANLRRRLRNLRAAGKVAFEVVDGRDDLAGLLKEGFRVEGAGWKGSAGTAIASEDETHRFYTAVAEWASRRGWLRLAYLRFEGRALAFDLSLECGDRHYLVKTGYDPEFARYSPGSLLRRHMIEDAFARGLRSYEFLGDDNEWKQDWTRSCRRRLTIKTFSPTLLGTVDYLATSMDDPVTRKLRSAVAAVVRR